MLSPVDPGRLDVVRQLTLEFAGVLPPFAIAAEVVAAESELRGQVPGGSLDEMLHRLVAQRLRELVGATH
jgi:hypothetical protein